VDEETHDELETQELQQLRRAAEALEALAVAAHRIALALELKD